MAKTNRKNSGDFDAILAGFAQQPSKKAPAYQARRPAPQDQSKPTSGAPRSENTVRRIEDALSARVSGENAKVVQVKAELAEDGVGYAVDDNNRTGSPKPSGN